MPKLISEWVIFMKKILKVLHFMSCLRVFLNTSSIQKKIGENLEPGQLRFRAVLSGFYFPQFVKIPTHTFIIHSDLYQLNT